MARHSVSRRTVFKSMNKSSNTNTRSAQTKEALLCYECEGLGHFAREYPTRHKGKKEIIARPGGKQRRTFKAFAATRRSTCVLVYMRVQGGSSEFGKRRAGVRIDSFSALILPKKLSRDI